jgi:cohesin loading factor subunit SCC2
MNEVGIFCSILSLEHSNNDIFQGPLEKLTSLIEDIFEAEDALPADIEIPELNHDFFSPLSTDCARPLLSPAIVRKLTKYIGQVARPASDHRRRTGHATCERQNGRRGHTDPLSITQLLDRSVRAGEDIDPFLYHRTHHVPSSTKSSPRKLAASKNAKTKKGDTRSKSQTPKDEDGMAAGMQVDEQDAPDLGDADFDKLSRLLDVARDGIVAADCCIALLGSDRLTKQASSDLNTHISCPLSRFPALFRRIDNNLSKRHQKPT